MKTHAIVLAAGKGTRLAEVYDIPKPLLPLSGKPVISYVLERLQNLNIHPVIVIKHKKEIIQEQLGNMYSYVVQGEDDGTGAAVRYAFDALCMDKEDTIFVINADDSAFLTQDTLKKFMDFHETNKADLTVMTVKKENPYGYGRIVKDPIGKQLVAIVEEKDTSEDQKSITEVNTGIFCFQSSFLSSYIHAIQPNEHTGEYYITDLVALGKNNNKCLTAYVLEDDSQICGFNTPEQYLIAQQHMERIKLRN